MHTDRNGDFSQAEKITHSGALLVGTYDNFTDGDPSEFLRNLNDHMPTARENQLIFIETTGEIAGVFAAFCVGRFILMFLLAML